MATNSSTQGGLNGDINGEGTLALKLPGQVQASKETDGMGPTAILLNE